MRFARSRFNNRAAFLDTPIGTKVAFRSAATMPTKMKITDWMRRMGLKGSVSLVQRDGKDEWVGIFPVVMLSILEMRADGHKGYKKALMSERACIQKIADSVEHATEDVRWEVANELACCLLGRSCEESAQSLAAWYGSLLPRFPRPVIDFVSSVSALDLDQSFHVQKVLEVLKESNAEQVRSAVAVGNQQRRRERQAACCPRALGAVHAQQPETQEATTESEGIEEHIRWQNELAHEIKRNTRRMAMQPCERPTPAPCAEEVAAAALGAVHTQQPETQEATTQSEGIEEHIRRQNELAHEIRQNTRRMAMQTCGRPTPAPCPEEVAEVCQKGISKKARRHQAKKAEQRRLQELRQQRFKQKGDEEFVKIAKNVEQFKQEEETTVKMDLECLTEELDAKLRDLEWEKRRQECGVEARSFPTKAQLLRCHIQGGVQRGEQMRREVIAFVQGIAKDMLVPEAASFADALVTKLLAGAPSDFDSVAAWCVYGPLARAFCSRTWEDPLLARTRHGVVVAAAATVS